MARVIWSRPALSQLQVIFDYIEQFDEDAARRTAERLLAAGDSLQDFPRRGRPAGIDARELVTVPPYIIRYKVLDDTVTIVAVRHGAQRPQDAI